MLRPATWLGAGTPECDLRASATQLAAQTRVTAFLLLKMIIACQPQKLDDVYADSFLPLRYR
jgi:hypothetical protein